jgi:LacI family transcriptional regulator
VGLDNFAATAAAMDHLIGLGHREFAMIAGNVEGNDRQRARVAAYRYALGWHQLGGADRIEHRSYTGGMREGAAATGKLLDEHPRITALVCNSDIFVVGAMAECRKRGLRVPNDISIMGFDDQEFASLLDPPITTIAVPAAEMGAQAARMLHAALSSGEPLRHEHLPTPLILRGSTGAPRR